MQAQGRLGELLDGGKPVRAVRLGVPRSDGVSALMWLLAVAANDDIPPVVTDDINPFEAYALAAILGLCPRSLCARRSPGSGRGQGVF